MRRDRLVRRRRADAGAAAQGGPEANRPTTLITDLGVGKQQLVEIAKALSKEVKLLILDEPTASLNESDSDALLDLLLEFKKHGISSILISHKLNEISKVADSITVLRDGGTVETLDCRDGGGQRRQDHPGHGRARRWPTATRKRDAEDRRDAVRGEGLERPSSVHADRLRSRTSTCNVRRGEIVGIAGLMGAGRTEFAMSVFGALLRPADQRQGRA